MIEQRQAFWTTNGAAFEDWHDSAVAEAVDWLKVWLPDFEGRDDIALAMALVVYGKDRDVAACEAWGRLYRIPETEPGVVASGLDPPPMAECEKPAFMRSRQQKQTWFPKIFAGGKT